MYVQKRQFNEVGVIKKFMGYKKDKPMHVFLEVVLVCHKHNEGGRIHLCHFYVSFSWNSFCIISSHAA